MADSERTKDVNKPRAISAQLVDIRNVGAHKSIKLTIHIPEEQARQIVDMFGWPTMVDPVPVALARLIEQPSLAVAPDAPSERTSPGPARKKQSWDELKPSAQISIRCGETAFRAFLREKFPRMWNLLDNPDDDYTPAETAIKFVRQHCGVASRADINSDNPQALDAWERLESDYRAWQQAPAMGAA